MLPMGKRLKVVMEGGGCSRWDYMTRHLFKKILDWDILYGALTGRYLDIRERRNATNALTSIVASA